MQHYTVADLPRVALLLISRASTLDTLYTRLTMITLIIVFALVTALPIKWAADFTGGERTGWFVCLAAAFLGPVVAAIAFRLASGGFIGFVVSYLALVTTYAVALRVPGRSIVGFSVVVLTLQIAVGFALVSFGIGGPKVILGA